MGELAMDDIWFGGQTKNPWNLQQGSNGSSAGSASTCRIGTFAIGTETYGYCSTFCGVWCNRVASNIWQCCPNWGMNLAWTYWTICRSAEDCAMVFASYMVAIHTIVHELCL
jgi:Asp-tRNA(Asn)/Glu-tRNA(Gln) amidotransferase A subunit family amidase